MKGGLASGTLGKDINLNKELPAAITKAKNLGALSVLINNNESSRLHT
mgnify:CR=1 FL=1